MLAGQSAASGSRLACLVSSSAFNRSPAAGDALAFLPRTLPRSARSSGSRFFSSSAGFSKQRVAIIGSGWAGYEVLRKINKREYDVIMLSRSAYFTFTPLLASSAVGTIEFRCALEPVRRFGDQIAAFQARVDSIDFHRKKLTCTPATTLPETPETHPSYPGQRPFDLHFDKLVIAPGAYAATFDIPGVREHAYFLKDGKDARRIRSRIIQCFEQGSQPTLTDAERAALLHFVVVGGGPTGVEFAAELHDLIGDLYRSYPKLAPLARITIFDVAEKILGAFDAELVKYATEKFSRQGITIKNNRHVTSVGPASIEVAEEGTVPYGLLVWSTGLAPNPLIESITELKKDPKTHSLEVDDRLRCLSANEGNEPVPDVYALGDASVMQSNRLPATAQVASQQGAYVAKMLNAEAKGRRIEQPFQFKNAGVLAYVGDYKALFDRSQASSGPKVTEAGRIGWLTWRSAYLIQTRSLRNMLLTPVYWTINWFLGRDITRF